MSNSTPLNIHISPEFAQLGIKSIAYAIITGANNQIPYGDELEDLLNQAKDKAMMFTDLSNLSVLDGYRDMIRNQGRSLKKFPPSAEAFIRIIQHRAVFPKINPIVDIYNAGVIDTFMAVGAHDLEKVKGDIYFRISEGEEEFIPIGSTKKTTLAGDFVYADEEKILAWLNTRDSEEAKITADTQNLILMIQGNPNTSLEKRLDALEKQCQNITRLCGGEYTLYSSEVPQ